MSQQNQFREITKGILLLIGMHAIAGLFIYFLGLILQLVFDPYTALGVLIIGFGGFSICQLLYVIPMCIRLKRKRKFLMMKGVIIGAVITALLNGGCFLLVGR